MITSPFTLGDWPKEIVDYWDNVGIAMQELFGLFVTDPDDPRHLDGKTLRVLAAAHDMAQWEMIGAWTPEYMADRLHRRLGLR